MFFDEARHLAALQSYKQHSGKEFAERSSPYDPPSMKDFAPIGLDRTYGDAWSRPGLDLKTRSFICMTINATLGCEDQLRNHIMGAHNVGVTKDEVVEWLIQMNGYIGTPRTGTAVKVVREAWKAMAEQAK